MAAIEVATGALEVAADLYGNNDPHSLREVDDSAYDGAVVEFVGAMLGLDHEHHPHIHQTIAEYQATLDGSEKRIIVEVFVDQRVVT
jgi:hypothetical protein